MSTRTASAVNTTNVPTRTFPVEDEVPEDEACARVLCRLQHRRYEYGYVVIVGAAQNGPRPHWPLSLGPSARDCLRGRPALPVPSDGCIQAERSRSMPAIGCPHTRRQAPQPTVAAFLREGGRLGRPGQCARVEIDEALKVRVGAVRYERQCPPGPILLGNEQTHLRRVCAGCLRGLESRVTCDPFEPALRARARPRRRTLR